MTEEEKSYLRAYKVKAIGDLQQAIIDHPEWMEDTDARIGEYLVKVAENPEGHNLYEILGCVRYFELRERYAWNEKRVKNFFRFYESLRFNGATGRRKYKLTPVQCFQFANIFGFMTPDGERLIRTAYIFVPRKFSKTTSAASLAVYDMLLGDYNAQAYVGANSYEQAKICFDEIRAIMRDIDPSEKTFRVNREKITFKNNKRDSFIRCLTANAKTQDGLNASLVIMDEYSQARNTKGKNGADLKNVLTSSMGVRKSPLTVIITTASEVIDGPFAHELEGVKTVLRGERKSDTVFASLFMPDVDDKEDDPNTWRKVQPHLGVTVQEDFYEKEYETAQLSAENMMVFRTKLLNIFAENETRTWISSELAKDMSVPMDLETLTGRPNAMVAIDLSESDDFSAVTLGVYDYQRKGFDFRTDYFFPEGALREHPNERLYRIWAEKGHLHLTEGDVIDYRVIVEHVLKLGTKARILKIGYDSWKSQDCVNMLGSAGGWEYLKPVKQSYGAFTAPVESFEHGAKTGRIRINDNPINWYCFGNAVLDYDNLENCKPIKRSHNQKIDGVITMLMCMRLFMDEER